GQSILAGTAFEGMMVKDGIDATSVEGASTLPYRIPNLGVELHSPKMGVPVQWWRSVGSTHTAFSTETFFDELAASAGKDPFQLRRALLAKSPRNWNGRSEEHTSELQSLAYLVCRLLLEKKKKSSVAVCSI